MPRGLGSLGLGDSVFRYGLGQGGGGGSDPSFTPEGLAHGQWWLDPYDVATMTLRNVAATTTGGNYLSRADTGAGDPFNFQGDGTSTRFNLSLWFYLPAAPPNNFGLCGKTRLAATTTDNGVWALRLGGTANQRLQLLVWKSGTATGLQQIDFTPAGGVPLQRLNHVVIIYDGSLVGDDTDVVQCWLNGSLLTTPAGTGLPQKFQNPASGSPPFHVGQNLGTSSLGRFCDLVLDGSRIWDSDDVAALWNGRKGISGAAALTSAGFTGLTASYRLNESSSTTRVDDSGNGRDLSVTGSVPAIAHVVQWQDKINGDIFLPFAEGPNTAQGGRSAEGIYSATVRNGKPGVQCLPWNYYYKAGTFNNAGGHIWIRGIIDVLPGAELLMALFADDANDGVFKYNGIINQVGGSLGAGVIDLVIRARVGSNPNGEINNLTASWSAAGTIAPGNSYLTTGSEFYQEVANLNDGTTGVGGTSANPNGPYRLNINGADQAAFIADGGGGTLTNWWNDNFTATNFCLNGLARLGPTTPGVWQVDQGGYVTFGSVVVSDAGESSANRIKMNSYLAAH